MKLSCKVIEDILPMYYDGVCSEDSAALVEEHLKECPACSAMLSDLQSGIELPQDPVDDLKPLEEIRTEWKKEKCRSAQKGACITLAAILTLFAVLTGIWYFGYAIHYDQLAGKLEKITDEAAAMTTAGHALEYGDYVAALKKPAFLGSGGFVHIGDREGMVIFLDEDWNEIGQNKDMCIDLFFYPQFGGGYKTVVMFDNGKESWGTWLTPELTCNAELYDASEMTVEEIAQIDRVLADYHEEVADLVDAAKEIWDIDLFHD